MKENLLTSYPWEVRNDDRTLSDAERLEIIDSYTDENDEVIVLTNILASSQLYLPFEIRF